MRTRIISAAVGVAVLIVVLIFHSTFILPAAVALMTALMIYELLRAVKLQDSIPLLAVSELCGIVMPFIYSGDSVNAKFSHIAFAVSLAAVFAIFMIWLADDKKYTYEQIFFTIGTMILIPQSMSTIVRIDRYSEEHGLFLLILGLCGAWIADTGAYFSGTLFGKHKLCPEISPKKTVEGLVGGIVTTGVIFILVALIYGKLISDNPLRVNYFLFAVLGMVCAVIGTIGDLSASLIKRQCGIKDYGKIMPGHGGMMDRFDSVLFVLPTFYAFIVLTGAVG